jgi:tetratricopeptide (TPR) repeat protein
MFTRFIAAAVLPIALGLVPGCEKEKSTSASSIEKELSEGKQALIQGDGGRAFEHAENVLRIAPDSAAAYVLRGQSQLERSKADPNKDLKRYQGTVRQDMYQAKVMANTSRIKYAIKDFSKAIELDKQNGEVYFLRATAVASLREKGRLKEVIEDCTSAIRLNAPSRKDAYKLRAQSYRTTGELEKAKADEEAAGAGH